MDTMARFTEFVACKRAVVDHALERHLPLSEGRTACALDEALRYALFSGGKRLRPLITLLVAESLGVDLNEALPVATAVEYLHTSSLILDDLPCMDDAALRRGNATLHVRYGEGLAILVAMAFLNRAYELVIECRSPHCVEIHQEMTRAIGAGGMILGQAQDLVFTRLPEGSRAEEQGMRLHREINRLKTTSLFRFCVLAGAMLGNAPHRTLSALEQYSVAFGTAFQLKDDLEDIADDHHLTSGDTPCWYDIALLQRKRRVELQDAIQSAGEAAASIHSKGLSHLLSELLVLVYPAGATWPVPASGIAKSA